MTARRPDAPATLEAVVTKLLHKDLSQRYQHADEVLAALRAVQNEDAAPTPAPRAAQRSWQRWARWAAPLLLALLLGVWALGRQMEPSAPAEAAPNAPIAVLPFSVRGGEELSYLHEGMVVLLSTKLDGTGSIRSIDPHALLSFAARDPDAEWLPDPAQGRAVAHRFNAGQFILGTVLKIGDGIQLNASLYDAQGVEEVRAQTVVPDETQLLEGIDDLARQLVASQLHDPGEQLAGLAAMTTPSFAALKAYLHGEEALSAGHFEEAIQELQHAVAQDSTFALAWYRLARAAGWLGGAGTRLNETATEQALRHSDALPERARTLIAAYHAYRTGDPLEAERLYRVLLARYPDDMETWLLLGETLFHNNPFYGRPTAEARAPLQRAWDLAPGSREVLVHLMDLAAKDGRREALDTLTTRYLQPPAGREDARLWHVYRALRAWTLGTPAEHERAFSDLQQAGPDAIRGALLRVAPQLEDLSTGRRLAALLTATASTDEERATGQLYAAQFEVAAGRWNAARALYDGLPAAHGPALVQRALAAAVPHAPHSDAELKALQTHIAQWDPDRAPLPALRPGESAAVKTYLLALVRFQRGDQETLPPALEQLAGEAPPLAPALARTLQALQAWQAGRPAETLAHLDAAQLSMPFHRRASSPIYEQVLNRYLRAEALYAEGRYEEALRWYTALYDGYYHWGASYLGASLRRRAEIHERLGDPEQAAHFYRRLVALWRGGDPPARRATEQAQRRLDRLTAGRGDK